MSIGFAQLGDCNCKCGQKEGCEELFQPEILCTGNHLLFGDACGNIKWLEEEPFARKNSVPNGFNTGFRKNKEASTYLYGSTVPIGVVIDGNLTLQETPPTPYQLNAVTQLAVGEGIVYVSEGFQLHYTDGHTIVNLPIKASTASGAILTIDNRWVWYVVEAQNRWVAWDTKTQTYLAIEDNPVFESTGAGGLGVSISVVHLPELNLFRVHQNGKAIFMPIDGVFADGSKYYDSGLPGNPTALQGSFIQEFAGNNWWKLTLVVAQSGYYGLGVNEHVYYNTATKEIFKGYRYGAHALVGHDLTSDTGGYIRYLDGRETVAHTGINVANPSFGYTLVDYTYERVGNYDITTTMTFYSDDPAVQHTIDVLDGQQRYAANQGPLNWLSPTSGGSVQLYIGYRQQVRVNNLSQYNQFLYASSKNYKDYTASTFSGAPFHVNLASPQKTGLSVNMLTGEEAPYHVISRTLVNLREALLTQNLAADGYTYTSADIRWADTSEIIFDNLPVALANPAEFSYTDLGKDRGYFKYATASLRYYYITLNGKARGAVYGRSGADYTKGVVSVYNDKHAVLFTVPTATLSNTAVIDYETGQLIANTKQANERIDTVTNGNFLLDNALLLIDTGIGYYAYDMRTLYRAATGSALPYKSTTDFVFTQGGRATVYSGGELEIISVHLTYAPEEGEEIELKSELKNIFTDTTTVISACSDTIVIKLQQQSTRININTLLHPFIVIKGGIARWVDKHGEYATAPLVIDDIVGYYPEGDKLTLYARGTKVADSLPAHNYGGALVTNVDHTHFSWRTSATEVAVFDLIAGEYVIGPMTGTGSGSWVIGDKLLGFIAQDNNHVFELNDTVYTSTRNLATVTAGQVWAYWSLADGYLLWASNTNQVYSQLPAHIYPASCGERSILENFYGGKPTTYFDGVSGEIVHTAFTSNTNPVVAYSLGCILITRGTAVAPNIQWNLKNLDTGAEKTIMASGVVNFGDMLLVREPATPYLYSALRSSDFEELIPTGKYDTYFACGTQYFLRDLESQQWYRVQTNSGYIYPEPLNIAPNPPNCFTAGVSEFSYLTLDGNRAVQRDTDVEPYLVLPKVGFTNTYYEQIQLASADLMHVFFGTDAALRRNLYRRSDGAPVFKADIPSTDLAESVQGTGETRVWSGKNADGTYTHVYFNGNPVIIQGKEQANVKYSMIRRETIRDLTVWILFETVVLNQQWKITVILDDEEVLTDEMVYRTYTVTNIKPTAADNAGDALLEIMMAKEPNAQGISLFNALYLPTLDKLEGLGGSNSGYNSSRTPVFEVVTFSNNTDTNWAHATPLHYNHKTDKSLAIASSQESTYFLSQ